ncbi:MAG: hypothetical protein AAF799_00725 [Myxococcota bacterium]
MSKNKTTFDSRPTAQQVLGAIVKAMRLRGRMDRTLGATTRKTFEQGKRVKPDTRTAYVFALASDLVEVGFPRPLEDDDPVGREGLVELVARGLGEYCIEWDRCQNYFESYGVTDQGADPLLVCLPMLRLALQDLGVRIGLHYLPWHQELPGTLRAVGPQSLVDGTAFVKFLRHHLHVRGRRRAELHTEVFGPSSYEAWERGGLPQSESLEALAQHVGQNAADRMRLELEFRAVVALVELWRWLSRVGLPEAHRLELARCFIEWTVSHAIGFAAAQDGSAVEIEENRLWGMLRGPRHPPIGHGVGGMGRFAKDDGFEDDLCCLSGNWTNAIVRWSGFLAGTAGAEDVRAILGAELPKSWSDRDVVAWKLVQFRLKENPTIYDALDLTRDPRCSVPDPLAEPPRPMTAREREALATLALDDHAFQLAERILREALEKDPLEPWLHIKLAQALEGQGRLGEADHAVSVAIGLDRTIVDAHMLRARILLSAGRPAAALDELVFAEKIDPKDAANPEFRGYCFLGLGRLEDALQAFVCSRTLNPRHRAGWTGEAMLLAQTGRFREAERAAKEAAHLGDGSVLLHVREAKAAGSRSQRSAR